MKDRGLLVPGAFADIVIFQAEAIDSPATYESPEQAPIGIRAVYRNGISANDLINAA